MRAKPSASTFDERQTLPAWVRPVIIVLSIPPLVVTSIIVVGESGVTTGSIGVIAAVVAPSLGILPLLNRSELRTRVCDDGVYFRFRPFHRSWRSISFDEIDDVQRSERRAFQHGIRWTRWGWEYRPDASEGVEIYRAAGRPIFLGSERPSELRLAIEEGMRA